MLSSPVRRLIYEVFTAQLQELLIALPRGLFLCSLYHARHGRGSRWRVFRTALEAGGEEFGQGAKLRGVVMATKRRSLGMWAGDDGRRRWG
jgi:hypothetical protein